MGRTLEFALGALNGVVGDYLARTGNGLSTEMSFVHEGAPLVLERRALEQAYPNATGRICVLVHGLMCTEDIFRFPEEGGDYGSFLERDLGYTPFRVRYNSGLPIADNGIAFSGLMDALLAAYPLGQDAIQEILLIGYSMGGLVLRGAFHEASANSRPWVTLVKRSIYVGTPHRGAPLERAGRVLTRLLGSIPDPYTRLVTDIANLRSDGIKDLGDGDVRHEDRARRIHSFSLRDPRHPVPLLPTIKHYLVAGSVSVEPLVANLFGDAVVPVPSATDGVSLSKAQLAFHDGSLRILAGLGHVELAHHPDVYKAIMGFLEEAP